MPSCACILPPRPRTSQPHEHRNLTPRVRCATNFTPADGSCLGVVPLILHFTQSWWMHVVDVASWYKFPTASNLCFFGCAFVDCSIAGLAQTCKPTNPGAVPQLLMLHDVYVRYVARSRFGQGPPFVSCGKAKEAPTTSKDEGGELTPNPPNSNLKLLNLWKTEGIHQF